jgi:hypothetical protein
VSVDFDETSVREVFIVEVQISEAVEGCIERI